MSAVSAEILSLRRFGDDQIVTLAKLAIENAFQPIAEISTGAVFGYETLMRGYERLGFYPWNSRTDFRPLVIAESSNVVLVKAAPLPGLGGSKRLRTMSSSRLAPITPICR